MQAVIRVLCPLTRSSICAARPTTGGPRTVRRTGSSSKSAAAIDLTGAYNTTNYEQNTTTLIQSGYNANGTYALNESMSDSPTITLSGNAADGTQSIYQTGSQNYSLSQTNSDGSDNYTLTGTGSNPYTITGADDANTGDSHRTTTGTADAYTLTQTGSESGTAFSLTLTGSDGYTTNSDSNSQSGAFSQTTTGSGSYSKVQGTVTTTGSTGFSSTEVGSTRDGDIVLTNSGTSRYDLLYAFNNTSDGGNGAAGLADFSPVGLPVLVGRASVPAGIFSSVGDDRYDYCFAAGTLVVMANAMRRAIETILRGERVMAVPDGDPTARPRACEVIAVYHNAPARLFLVKTAGQTIHATGNHPLYVDGKGWIHAEDLLPGDRLRTDGGEWVAVESVNDSGQTEPVFNLQVAECHTYFVAGGPGDVAVLAHNESAAPVQAPVATPSPVSGGDKHAKRGRVGGGNRATRYVERYPIPPRALQKFYRLICLPSFPWLLAGLAEAVALAVHLEDVAAVGEAVQQGRRHPLALEDLAPFAEGQVAGDQDAAALVAVGEDLEQQFGPAAAEAQVAQLVDDQQVHFVQLADVSRSRRYCFCASSSWLTSPAAVKNRTRLPTRHAAWPRAIGQMRLARAGVADEADVGLLARSTGRAPVPISSACSGWA